MLTVSLILDNCQHESIGFESEEAYISHREKIGIIKNQIRFFIASPHYNMRSRLLSSYSVNEVT